MVQFFLSPNNANTSNANVLNANSDGNINNNNVNNTGGVAPDSYYNYFNIAKLFLYYYTEIYLDSI